MTGGRRWSTLAADGHPSAPPTLVGLLPVGLVVILAPLVVILRLALTGVLVARLRGDPWSVRTVLAGVSVAGVGLLVVVLKLWLTH